MELTRIRQLMQLAGTVLSNSYIGTIFTKNISTGPLKGVCVPFLNCYACPSAVFSCPIGTLQHFAAIRAIPYYLIGFIAVVGLTVGRMACGWLCPFGFLQDMMHKIPSPKMEIPGTLRYVKYLVLLLLVIVLPYLTAEMTFSILCPAGTLTAGLPWAIWNPVNPQTGLPFFPDGQGAIFFISLFILIVFLVFFILTKRPFCRIACPMGALLAFFNKYSMVQLKVSSKCDGCNICRDLCPVDINISMEEDSGECIRCLECTRCAHVKLSTPFSSDIKAQKLFRKAKLKGQRVKG
ncbi:Putative 4Fe-4S ferredoxin (NapH-type), iron-sulfur binding membrane protein. Homology with gene DMR_41050 of RS-1. Named HMP4 in GenBank [Desulfamplus magnetovallimortis]|uniref:HMP4 n=2 Tax=Desulfamplus magnetovallimortis TaxID=1246637 RepID=G9JKC0_9BACT|nr:4Fe-4S binding protein [Desulfamplus magnetovallimortis]AEX00098.1 HMP4 [Desulfamplus magnetovallimortis BW-1]CCO06684.1 Putative 4Fe-4S ferredoxin (NapH-type),iron-sulfur binding membrane protein. Homology with gene DMR_41050 of RS-1. Named HMP4 in GenBank [Desulfamplus magnetovallimortis BW-1]SLM32735.1 Putative 4Fe-4S ferredoxin (NapH-type), iron-sulfur binding membrane protein. Homology with gene DMR_41050 of RS-1. Named HMP4 in GenBank [Desulfamplus magnetovallimortis]